MLCNVDGDEHFEIFFHLFGLMDFFLFFQIYQTKIKGEKKVFIFKLKMK